jgi:hypothetical protein
MPDKGRIKLGDGSTVVTVKSRQGDLLGADRVEVPLLDVAQLRHGRPKDNFRRAVEMKRQGLGMTQAEVAQLVGVSRPQYVNGIHGRFGFGSEATAKLKEFLFAA